MPTVPPLEDTKAMILKTKGMPWLKEQEAKFTKSYGESVKDPAMRMWLIAKQGGLEVTEIKADAGGAEGDQVMIAQIHEYAKSPEDHGWTHVKSNGNGVDFIKPDTEDKYSISVVVLDVEEGETKNGGAKLNLIIADATGVAKLDANSDGAVKALIEMKVRRGSVLDLPLCQVKYGHHNFGAQPNKVWWKFSLPPFGEVRPSTKDVREFFLNLDSDTVKEDRAAMILGFITHVEERESETCTICNRWITTKNQHEKCREEENFQVKSETEWYGTAASVAGSTVKLQFAEKPKVRLAVDLVEIFGKMNKYNALDVAFIRKPGEATPETPVTKAVAAAKPAVKPAVKKAPAPPTVEEAAPEEEEETPPPEPKPKRPVPFPKKAPEPAAEDETSDNGADEGLDVNEPADEQVVVRPAAKSPPKPVAKAAPATQETVEVVEVPAAVAEFVEKNVKQFGGKNMTFVLQRQAGQLGLLGDGTDEEKNALMTQYIDSMVAEGKLEYTTPARRQVKWTT